MSVRLSRRKIAAYCADSILAGKKDLARELAAFLVDSRRVRELELIVRDIESALADRGLLLAEAASSRKLSSEAANEIQAYLKKTTKADKIYLRQTVDENLLGGVRITIPGHELDATLRYKLNQLKSSKV